MSATLPGIGVLSAGVEGGSDVPPINYVLLFFIGAATVAFDAVGRGWIWTSKPEPDPARPELSFSLSDTCGATLLVNMRDIEPRKEDDGFDGAFLSP